MWPFNSKTSYDNAGFGKGITDWHCHLLPGVDDGVRVPRETLRILEEYETRGVDSVWFTPHIMEDCPNTTQELRHRFDEFCELYKGPIKLHLAAENMMDNLFDERLEAGDVLPLGTQGRHLLVETSYFSPPVDLDDVLMRVRSKGYVPVLAHPERYVYMDKRRYDEVKEIGVLFQLNLFSLAGGYGSEARDKARYLLKKGYYDIFGSDTHAIAQLRSAFAKPMVEKKDLQRLAEFKGLEQ